jgi:hypothetical protein
MPASRRGSARMTRPPTEAASPSFTLILIHISTAATHRPPFADNATAPSFPCHDFSHAAPSAPPVRIDPDPSWPHLYPLGLGRVGYRKQWDSREYGGCGGGREHCFHHAGIPPNSPQTCNWERAELVPKRRDHLKIQKATMMGKGPIPETKQEHSSSSPKM